VRRCRVDAPPPSPPAPARLAVAAVTAGAVAALGVSLEGPGASHVLLLPLLVVSGGWLCGRLLPRVSVASAAALTAALVAVPAATLRLWVGLTAADASGTVEPSAALHGLLTVTRRATGELAPVLAAGAVATALLWGRRGAAGAAILAAAAAGAAAARGGLVAALEALNVGDMAGTARWSLLVPWAAALVLPGALVGLAWQRPRPRSVGAAIALIVTAGLAAFAASPPLRAVEAGLRAGPAALPGVALPTGEAGAPVAAQAFAWPDLPEPAATFVEAETPPWSCVGSLRKWKRRPRLTAAIGLPPDGDLAVIDAAIDSLSGTHMARLALVGRADPAPSGPIGPWLAWPAASMLLDRPPHEAQWARFGPAGLAWIGSAPAPGDRAACALLLQPGVTVQQLYDTLRGLQDARIHAPCAAVAVVPSRWRPADPTADLSSLACPPRRRRSRH